MCGVSSSLAAIARMRGHSTIAGLRRLDGRPNHFVQLCGAPVQAPENYVLRYSRVEIHHSARRHGTRDADIRHAVDHALVVVDLDPDADPPKVLAIGPDRAGNLLEVIALELADDEALAIHAMALRPAFHDLLPRRDEEHG